MLPLWLVFVLCVLSFSVGIFTCSMMVIAKHQDRQQGEGDRP